jgi:hypothetical protein
VQLVAVTSRDNSSQWQAVARRSSDKPSHMIALTSRDSASIVRLAPRVSLGGSDSKFMSDFSDLKKPTSSLRWLP